jgi:hypothetical protein
MRTLTPPTESTSKRASAQLERKEKNKKMPWLLLSGEISIQRRRRRRRMCQTKYLRVAYD